MKLFNIHVITCNSVGDFQSKFKKRMILHTILESVKIVFLVAITTFFVLEYIAPLTQKSLRACFPAGMGEFLSVTRSSDSSVKEVLHLANVIRFITGNQLSLRPLRLCIENPILDKSEFVFNFVIESEYKNRPQVYQMCVSS